MGHTSNVIGSVLGGVNAAARNAQQQAYQDLQNAQLNQFLAQQYAGVLQQQRMLPRNRLGFTHRQWLEMVDARCGLAAASGYPISDGEMRMLEVEAEEWRAMGAP